MSDSVRPHRWQPMRLPRPWDSLGKNTGVGCHFLLQCRKVKSESEVSQLCPNLSDPMDCSPPGSSARGIFQARVLEWGAIAFPNITPLGLNYLIDRSLYLFITFILPPLYLCTFITFAFHLVPTSDNRKSLLFLHEFVCLKYN